MPGDNKLFETGFNAFKQGDFSNAASNLEVYLKESESQPESAEYKEVNQLIAESHLELGDFLIAKEHFVKAEMPAQAGFAAILAEDIKEAVKLYELAPDSLARSWGVFLCEFLGELKEDVQTPGFLTFRLFFESTITYIIKFNIKSYLDKLNLCLYQLEFYFPEIRKFIGSAYMSIDDLDNAEKFLQDAISICPQDVESHYKLGEVYFFKKNSEKATKSFDEVLKILPGHKSSLKYLEKLESV